MIGFSSERSSIPPADETVLYDCATLYLIELQLTLKRAHKKERGEKRGEKGANQEREGAKEREGRANRRRSLLAELPLKMFWCQEPKKKGGK